MSFKENNNRKTAKKLAEFITGESLRKYVARKVKQYAGYPIVVLLLLIGLPINYIITGNWGYSKRWNFILDWIDKIGG